MKEKKWWLDFDHETFEKSKNTGEYYGFLNVQVKNDNCSGDSEETVIVFDTDGFGGSHTKVEAKGFPEDYEFTSSKITLTLYGGMEADAFFTAMENLVAARKLRKEIGD